MAWEKICRAGQKEEDYGRKTGNIAARSGDV